MDRQRKQQPSSGIAKVTEAATNKHGEAKDNKSFRRDDGVRVEERLQLPHLQQLLFWFQNHQPRTANNEDDDDEASKQKSKSDYPFYKPRTTEKRTPGLLSPSEFKDTLVKVLGTHDFDEQFDSLFTKLDTSCDGYVDWNEFCTYMLLQFRENDYMRTKKQMPFQAEARIRHCVHNRQETTSKVFSVDNPTKYITVSKEGAIVVWDTHLHMEKHYGLTDGEEDLRGTRRRVKEWVTDAVYMNNCHKLAIASTGRDIRFFDTTSTQYFQEFCLYGLPNVVTCLHYWYEKQNSSGPSMLFCGDERGSIGIFTFHKPITQLFATPFKKEEGVAKVYFPEIASHSKWVQYTILEDIHPETVRKVTYMAENDCVISSSASPRSSVVIMDIQRKKKTYIFKLSKGVECYDYSKAHNLLVTGSPDHMARVWNPYVVSKPVGVLSGHSMAIVDLKIHEGLLQAFTYSRDTVLKVWDLREHTCLQTVIIKIPSSLLGRLPEYGPFCMHLQPPPVNSLIITANDYIAMLKVGQPGPPVSLTPTTHTTPLCCALYNPHFKQVVTGADDSTIAVWELESGAKSMLFTNAHGKEEITCMTFDPNWRRLFTGARDGTIKAVMEAEVTGVTPLIDGKLTLAVGWSRMITQYDDTDPDLVNVKANTNWKGGQIHKEDIVASAYSPLLNFFVTASFDGEICVWTIDRETLYVKLRKSPSQTPTYNLFGAVNPLQQSSSSIGSFDKQAVPRTPSSRPGSRPNSRHRKSHKPPPGEPVPVDKLLFLHSRSKVMRMEAAILVSSEAGVLRWWSIYGLKKELGCYYAAVTPDESVLGMCCCPEDNVLISGDTHGAVSIWDISTYCIYPDKNRIKAAPPLIKCWTAHDSAVVSVEYISHVYGAFILTASSDKTAKLFAMDGNCVGTFGQKTLWSLRDPESWLECPVDYIPPTPDVLQVKFKEGGDDDDNDNAVDDDDDDDEIKHLTNGTTPVHALSREDTVPVMERGDTLIDDVTYPTNKGVKAHSVAPSNPRTRVNLNVKENKLLTRSQTFDTSAGNGTIKSMLGSRVNKHLAQRAADRQQRRGTYGGLETDRTTQMGGLCCPYQVLATKDLSDIELPTNLPMTTRMQSQGLTPTSLTLDTIREMNLKEYPETPPSGEFSRQKSFGANLKASQDKSVKLPAIQTLKKSQTFVGNSGKGFIPKRQTMSAVTASES